MEYNATAVLRRTRHVEAEADAILDQLVDYHPNVGLGCSGRLEVTITLPGDSLRQAVTTAMAVLRDLDVDGLEVLPTVLWDERAGRVEIPALVSVTEAAEMLGTSRQAVQQRLESGSLQGQKVGKVWVLARGDVQPA